MRNHLFCSMLQVNVDCSEEERKQRCSMCLEEKKDEAGNCIHLQVVSEIEIKDNEEETETDKK